MVSGAFVLVWSYADSDYLIPCLYIEHIENEKDMMPINAVMHIHVYVIELIIECGMDLPRSIEHTLRTYTTSMSLRPILVLFSAILNRVSRFGFILAHRDLFKRLYNVSDFLSQ